jgi:tRNA (uracil-5-)-methyltransferase TRM9
MILDPEFGEGSPDDRFSHMDSATALRLTEINREFYRRVAPEFSRSRQRLNPGILRAFAGIPVCHRLLDVGCGDGRVGLAWVAGELGLPWTAECRYLGLDQSAELLAARAPWPEGLEAIPADLAGSGWPDGNFDVVCCFAALHHIPGRGARVEALRRIAGSLAPQGRWMISVWQFLHLERFRRRILDWSEVTIKPAQVDEGDLLLDWRRGPRALRYVHHYDRDELAADCREAGLDRTESWFSDGEDESLGLYFTGRLNDA